MIDPCDGDTPRGSDNAKAPASGNEAAAATGNDGAAATGGDAGFEAVLEVGELDHVGIAVSDLDAALERYGRLLGARPGHRERVEDQGVEVAFLRLPGTTRVELVAPLSDDSPVAGFLERRGEGLHHICVRVSDLERALERLAEVGEPLVDHRPRRGAAGSRIAFVHPRALGGVLLELKEQASG